MPKLINPLLYNAIYSASCTRLTGNLGTYIIPKTKGQFMYRYVGYRSSMPQAEASGRTIWNPLAKDTTNRWTGQGTRPGEGSQGLYLSGEFLDKDAPFPELEHYMNPDSNPNALVSYFKYEAGQAPKLTTAKVSELRSMFLFSLRDDISGLNFRYSNTEANPLLEEILELARKETPDAFTAADTLKSLYYNGEDASFCRALGNAVFSSTDLPFFETVSVRDGVSSNVIMRGETEKAIDLLKPEGRSSFLVNPETRRCEGVFTISDLLYNAIFEDPDAHSVLPSKAELNAKLQEVSKQIADNIVDAYTKCLEENPPTDRMQQVGKKILSIKNQLGENKVQEAFAEITEVKQSMSDLLKDRVSLEELEIRAFEVVDSVMGSLSDITTAIDTANKEMENPHEELEQPEDISISDPTEQEVDPVIESPHVD